MTVWLITRAASKVEHIGVWAYDQRSGADFYSTGRQVPICGRERDHGSWTWVESFWSTVESGHRRKRLCRDCRRRLVHALTLAIARLQVYEEPAEDLLTLLATLDPKETQDD